MAGFYKAPYQAPNLATGMAAPQKTNNPVQGFGNAPAPAAPAGQSWTDFSKSYGDLGPIGSLSGVHNSKLFDTMSNQIATKIGFTGNRSTPGTYQFENVNEGGTFMDTAQGSQASPEFLTALEAYQFSQNPNDPYKGTISQNGQTIGDFTSGNKPTSFDKFATTAIPLALAAMGGAAFGGYIPGAEIGAAGTGAGGAGAAAAGAADIGALGLTESVYGLGGALGEGAVAGTVGGLSGSTAAFGGLGSVLPAGVGFGEAAAGLGALDYGSGDIGGGQGDFGGTGPDSPEVFNAAKDSQLASQQLGITGAESAAAATAPASVNLGSAGTYATGGGMVNGIANALEAAKVNPMGTLASAGSSVLDFAKANPQLAAMGVGALGSLTGSKPEMPSTGAAGSGNLTPGAQQVAGSLGALDFSGIPGLKTSAGDRNTFNQEATDAAYGLQTRYLDPQIQQQQKALEARLSEQGFVPGTPAYNQAMQNFMDTNQRAYASARDSSILQGAQIGQGDFRNALSDATLNNSASAQALESYLAKRNQPINERNALLTGDQMVYGQQLDKYNAKVAESNNRNQALSQLALALGMYLG
jgi:hypothetical protein